MHDILTGYNGQGWVPEPAAKRLFSLAGLKVPRYGWANTQEEALRFAGEIGYPVVAKVVSSALLHKSDQEGVALGIADQNALSSTYERFRTFNGFAGVLVEEMVTGLELIVGAKIDVQFGPVILLGMGGTWAEIYRDVALRMAPIDEATAVSMAASLRGHRLLEGYRGGPAVNKEALSRFLVDFSHLVMDMEELIESIDLNPLMCSREQCIIADARIILNKSPLPLLPSGAKA